MQRESNGRRSGRREFEVRVPPTLRRQRWFRVTGRLSVVALPLAVAAALLVGRSLHREASTTGVITSSEGMQMIVAVGNELDSRVTEGRLSGGFRYKRWPSPKYGVTSNDVKVKLGQVSSQLRRQRLTPSVEHALGMAFLLLGDDQQAIAAFENALLRQTGATAVRRAIDRSYDGRLLSDYAAALQNRGTSSDVRFAIEAAARAVTVWNGVEARWNYAVAVSKINLANVTVEAWRDYARYDRASGWYAESVHRIEGLSRQAQSPVWKDAQARLDSAFRTGDHTAVGDAISRSPQEVREWMEEAALAQWAEAHLQRGPSAAQRLRVLAEFAEKLARTTGDRSLSDHVAALQNVSHDCAQCAELAAKAHLEYRDSRRLFAGNKLVAAQEAAQRAAAKFERLSLPFRSIAVLTAASCFYNRRQFVPAADLAREVVASTATRPYPSVAARAHWILGLVMMESADPRDAIAQYEGACERFASMREVGNWAAATCLLAQAQDSIGLTSESWAGRLRALARHSSIPSALRRHGVLIEAAMAAVRSRDYTLARVLLDHLIPIDLQVNDSLGVAAALRLRSLVHHARGEHAAAADDLSAAREFAGRIGDVATRTLFIERLDTTAALELLHRNPLEAMELLSRVSADNGTPADVAERSMGLSAAHRAEPSKAIQELLAAIDALETRFTADGSGWPSPLIAQPLLSLYDESIALLMHSDRVSDALLLGERARLSVQRLNGYELSANSAPAWEMPPMTAAVAFYVAGDDLISWSVGAGGIRGVIKRGAAAETRRLAAQIVKRLDVPSDPARRDLGKILLDPHWDAVANATELLIVPDDVLWNVPFAAIQGQDGRFLANHFVLVLADSISRYLSCARESFNRPRSVLLIGGSRSGGPHLQPLPNARREIQQLWRSFTSAGVAVTETQGDLEMPALAAEADAIHFAGHLVPNEHDPGLTHLALSSGKRVYARDIRQWHLRKRPLVMLSSCDGAIRPGTHLQAWGSVADAFAFAGASGVVAATTRVDDRDASNFAVSFYSHLLMSTPAVALNNVQRSAAARRATPQEWASYAYFAGTCH